jgi:hypothetical protein
MVENRLLAQTDRLAPDAAVFQVSAVKGDGIPAIADWLAGRAGDWYNGEITHDSDLIEGFNNVVSFPARA